MKRFAFLCTIVAVASCSNPNEGPTYPLKLPSGKTVQAFAPGVAKFANDRTFYVLTYLTKLRLDVPMTSPQEAAAAAEAREIWPVFRPEVEKRGFDVARIQANVSRESCNPLGVGLACSTHGSAFCYMRDASGVWETELSCNNPELMKHGKEISASNPYPRKPDPPLRSIQ